MFSKEEQFAKELIKLHGFSSNTVTGFSCYIPDLYPFSKKEGLLLWVFSRKEYRFETQLQKFHTLERIHRMQDMLGIDKGTYKQEMSIAVKGYIKLLRMIGCFKKIGGGIDLFGDEPIWNYAADLKVVSKHPDYLKEIERVTINNPIVQFAEDWGYFKIKNANQLAWDNIYGDNQS